MNRHKFSDITYNITEKKMPVSGDEKLYIGLEHLDSGNLKITRWGSDIELKGQKLVMKKGDILFGRRNTYLRRVAIAPHDGIFSAHGMIFRPKTDIVNPDFFPFFLSSDYFMNEAIRISVGSLSPTVNWGTLKNLEFDLPSIQEQQQFGKILWAMERVKNAYIELFNKTDDLVKSRFVEMFGDPVENPMNWPTKSLLQLGSCKNGMNFHSNDSGVEINCLGVGDFKDNDVITETHNLPFISLNAIPPNDYLLKDGDIVFVRSNGNKTMVGRSVIVFPNNNPTSFSGFCIRFRKTDESINVLFLIRVLKTESIRKQMYGRGANIQNLNQKTLASINIPIPPIELQKRYITFVQQADKSKFAAQQALKEIINSQKALMKKIFV